MEENNLQRLNESTWRERFAAYHSSGLSKAEFCKTNAINKSTFYTWYQRLNPQNLAVPKRKSPFAKVEMISQISKNFEVRIQFPGGIEIQAPSYPEPVWVAEMIKALGSRGEL